MNTVEGFLGSAKGAMARRSGNATGLYAAQGLASILKARLDVANRHQCSSIDITDRGGS